MFDNPSWLVRVLAKTNDGTATAGTGIAIDQRHVITCAHVLASAATNGEPVLLELPFNKAVPGRIGATVLFSHYDSDRSEDFAVLRLDDEIPDMAPPPLHRATTFKGRQAKARGFPWAESSVSSVAEVVLWDQTHRGRIQLNRSTTEGDILKGGFSGGPVWDSNVEAVIGIVVSAEANGSGAMLTLDSLQDLWPELEDRIGRFPIKTSDYESHWGPRATGSTLALSGSRFSGRSVALRQINKALADKPTPNIPTVVTGNPGAGKSAVLARIVTTAVTAPADGHRGAADEWISAKPGSVHCAVHAKGKTPDEIAAEILLAAGLHELQDIDRFPVRINVALADRERFNVVIDALDEVVPGRRKKSGNPVRDVIVKIIKPLAAIRAASVVIGSRKYAGVDVGKLLSDAAFIDLDTDDYFDPDDLVRFVSATLQDTSRDRNVAVYEDDAIAMPIAVRIAEVSNTNFLVASLLAHRHGLLDVEPVAPEDIQFSGAAKDAFREYLECLPKIKGVSADAREMLTALAFAESPGFTVDLWTAAVNCLENVTVEPDALLAFAKGPAANFLIEASTGAVPQFQLFHQALIDAAREWIKEDRRSIEECNAKLAKEFQQRVERIGWDRAPSYLTRSLATHAAAGNQLDELLKSLDFLSYADPSTLLAAMRAQPGIRERRIASAYRTRAHLYQAIPPGSARAQRILIDLARAGVKNFGIESAEACWRPRWCVGGVFDPNLVQAYSTAHRRGDANIEEEDDRVLFRGGDGEELVWKLDDDYRLTVFRALSEDPRIMGKGIVDNRSVGAEGGEDGTIHIWDLESGETVALFLAGPPDPIGLAIGEVGGRSLVINGTEDGPVVVWDLETREHVMRFEGHSDWVRSVAFGKVDGAPVAISAGDDNTVRVWDLAAGKQRAVLEGHTEWVESVAFGEVDGSPIAVSGGDDETVRVWDLRTGEQTMLDSEAGLVKAVAFGRFYGAPIAIVGNDDEIVRVWDLRTKRLMLELEGHSEQVTTVAFGEIDNIPVAISGSEDDTVRVWDLRTGAQRAVLEGHTDWVSSVAFGEIDNIPVAISGSDDNTVRVWDLRTGEQRAVLEGHTGGVLKVAFSRIDRRPVAVSTSEDDSVRVWDLQSAAPYISLGRHADWVNSIVFGAIGGTPVAISGSDDETVRVWDLRNQMQMLHFQDHIDAVNAVAFGEIDGTSIVISGSEDETVRVWDLTSGSQRATFDGHDDAVNAVAFGEIDGTPVVISGSEDETVRVWDLTSGSQRATFDGHDDAVNAVAFGEVDGMPIAVSGGTDRSVRVWNLATMRQIQAFHGHAGRVLRIEICWVAGQPMVVSESEDESIRIWELRGPDGSAEVSVDDTKQTGSPQENKVDSIVFGTLGGDGVVFGGGEDGSVRAWDLLDGSERAVMRGHDGPVSTVAYGHIGGTPVLVSGGQDRTVQVWDLVQQKRRSTHQAHDHWVSNVAFGEIAGRPLATSTGGDGAIRIWDLRRRKLAAAFQDPLPWVRSVAFGAVAGQPCFIGGGQDGVQAWGFKPRLGWLNRRWSPRAPRALMSFDGDEESDRPQVAFGEIDGTTVILYGRLDGSVVCFRPEDPTDKVVLEGHKDLVTALAFGKISDRPIVVTGSRDLSVRIWDLRDRREIDRLEIGALVRSVALAAPGTVVVSAGTEVICFDVPSLQAIAEGRAEGR